MNTRSRGGGRRCRAIGSRSCWRFSSSPHTASNTTVREEFFGLSTRLTRFFYFYNFWLRLNVWLPIWFIHRRIDWLNDDLLIHWNIFWLIDSLIDWLITYSSFIIVHFPEEEIFFILFHLFLMLGFFQAQKLSIQGAIPEFSGTSSSQCSVTRFSARFTDVVRDLWKHALVVLWVSFFFLCFISPAKGWPNWNFSLCLASLFSLSIYSQPE